MSTCAAIPAQSSAAAARSRAHAPGSRRLRIPSGIVWLALAAIAAYFLLPQIETLGAALRVAAVAQPVLVALGVALVVLRYAMAAVSLQAAVPAPLAFWPTLLVQLASAFVGRFTPEGLGWLVLNQRFLERAGVDRATALAAISLKILVGGLSRLLIAAAIVVLAGREGLDASLPSVSPSLLLAATVIAVAIFAVGVGVVRSRPSLRERILVAATSLRTAMRDRRRLIVLIASSASLTVLSGLALATSAFAVGADVSIVALFAVYLGGTAIAAVSPTPGNIGAVEVALTAGLTALGVTVSTALAAVLIYRLLTFWLPVAPGFLALQHLRARSAL